MNSKGCYFQEHGISFERNDVYDCCITHGSDQRGMPLLIQNYNGEYIDWDKIFEIKEERIKRQKEKTIFECEGCAFLRDYEFSGEKYISNIAINNVKLCNAKCIYCSDEFRNVKHSYTLYPVIKDLVDRNLFRPESEITIQGGEPTLMQDFDNLVDLFISQNANIRVHTSGIKYSKSLENALSQGRTMIVVSIDSGTRELYKKIKFVDKFDVVCENLKKYLSVIKSENKENIRLKYLITPGYNDTIEDIDSWYKLIKGLGIKYVAFDIEVKYANQNDQKYVSPHIYMLVDYMKYKAEKLGIKYDIYSFLSYVLNERKFFKYKNLVKIKFLYKFITSFYRLTNLHKNFNYALPTNNMIEK